MRAVDTNVLLFAVLIASPYHGEARALLAELAEGSRPWAIPWPCLYEFLRLVTHPRVLHPPMPLAVALDDLSRIVESPSLVLLHETPRHFEVLAAVVRDAGATGNLLQDAHIAALCLEHGVTKLYSADRDLLRFPGLTVVDPFARRTSASLAVG